MKPQSQQETDPSPPTLGQRIRDARKAKKLTQQELADALGQSRSAVVKWENDKAEPRRETIEAMAALLMVSTDTFNRYSASVIPIDVADDTIGIDPTLDFHQIRRMRDDDIRRLVRGEPEADDIPLAWLYDESGLKCDSHFKYVAADDSMAPEILKHEVLQLDSARQPWDGCIIMVYRHETDEVCLRHYRDRGAGHFDAWPANPEFQTVTHTKTNPLTIVAVAVAHWRILNEVR